jgi:hypothetical protein
MSYEKQIQNSSNKMRTAWRIINRELHKKSKKDTIEAIYIDGKRLAISIL